MLIVLSDLFRLIGWRRLLLHLMGWTSTLLPLVACAGNFTCVDAEVAQRAEQARIESARFWTGEELPGRWSAPCPITVEWRESPGGGSTSFRFSGGEVFGWRMQLVGSRRSILDDVVPHEVDHMVRASLVRRPIPRWLDEGCALLRESPASLARQRAQARELARCERVPTIDAVFLDRFDYPTDPEELGRMYVLAFSLVDFLVEREGPRRMFAFQRDPRPPTAKLREYYQIEVSQLAVVWRDWVLTGERTGPPSRDTSTTDSLHADGPTRVLTVYTSERCRPCQMFWHDLQSDREFSEALTARYDLQRVDVDRNPAAASVAGVTTVPMFVGRGGRLTGYHGKEWLLAQLDAWHAAEPPEEQPPAMPTSTGSTAPSAEAGETSKVPQDHEAHDGEERLPASISTGSLLPSTVRERDGARLAGGSRERVMTEAAWPVAWSWLTWAGLLAGSAATGGVGACLAWGLVRWTGSCGRIGWKQANPSRGESPTAAGCMEEPVGSTAACEEDAVRAPFPRRLDEARELLRLGRSEGRVAVLDALRGMFLDDELDKLEADGTDAQRQWSRTVREVIAARVDEVAPLSVQVEPE